MYLIRAVIILNIASFFTYVFGYPWFFFGVAFLPFLREILFDAPPKKIKIPVQTVEGPEKRSRPRARVCVVTGSTSYLGRTLVQALCNQDKYDLIRAFDKSSFDPQFSHPKLEYVSGDVLKPHDLEKAFEDAETVFHVPGIDDLRSPGTRADHMRMLIVVGTQNVSNTCMTLGVTKFIFASSAFAYFDQRPGIPSEAAFENLAPNLTTPLAHCINEADQLVRQANGICGLRTLCLRPFLVYGEGEPRFTTPAVKRGITVDSNSVVSTCYIRHLIRFFLTADQTLDEKPQVTSGRGYFVADDNGNYRTWKKLNQEIFQAARPTKPLWEFGETALSLLAYFVEIIDWLFYGRLPGGFFQLGFGYLLYTFADSRFDCSHAMKDFAFKREYSPQQIADNLRQYYAAEK